MDTPELKPSPPADPNQWQTQFEDLRHLVISMLVLLVVVSGTFSVFMLRHWTQTRRDLAAYRVDASIFVDAYNKQGGPQMDAFIDKLKDYGKTHPDFVPILSRYGIAPGGSSAPPPATRTSTAPPKK
jgi:hypothetical protein